MLLHLLCLEELLHGLLLLCLLVLVLLHVLLKLLLVWLYYSATLDL